MRGTKSFIAAWIAAGALTIPGIAATPNHTRDLLRNVTEMAQVTETQAGRLQSYSADGLDWEAQGLALTSLKEEINNISRKVQRLQSEALPPGEKRLVDRVRKRVNMMAVDTEDAIVTGQENRGNLWDRSYRKDVRRIYSNAEILHRDARAAWKFASTNEMGG